MGKLADALDKAGYGEDNIHSKIVTEAEPQLQQDIIPDSGLQQEQDADLTLETQAIAEIETKPYIKQDLEGVQASGHAQENRKAESNFKAEPKSIKITHRPTVKARAWDDRLFLATHSNTYLPEVFKILRSRILHPINGRPIPRSIMVTSVAPQEGKSFVTASLGISLAQGVDQYSLLIDCDLRRPSLARMFGVDRNRGLVDFLRDNEDLSELMMSTSVDKLSLLPGGKPPVNPAELLGSSRMEELVKELSGRYDDRILIFDSPPVQVASESIVLAGQVDCVILVVREGGGSKSQIQKFLDIIDKERLLGVVFNAQTTNVIERSLLQGYGYYQGKYE